MQSRFCNGLTVFKVQAVMITAFITTSRRQGCTSALKSQTGLAADYVESEGSCEVLKDPHVSMVVPDPGRLHNTKLGTTLMTSSR